jgi:hypothetical protein
VTLPAINPVSAAPSQLNLILEYLGNVQRAMVLPGVGPVKQAYAYPLSDPSSDDCPFFNNELSPQSAPVQFMATTGFQRVVDLIEMWLCVARWEADASQQQSLLYTAQWRDLVFTTFARQLRLNNTFNFVTVAYLDAWAGVQKHAVGSTDYAAMPFRLHVEEQFTVTITP